MEFRILGPLEISEADHLVEVTAPKQRALLAVLLLSPGRVVSADRLIDSLWGDDAPAGGAKTLRYHVSKLRDALEPDRLPGSEGIIVTRAPGYVLDVSPDTIDAARFESLVRDAQRFLSADPAYASTRLQEALGLWRGPALADFFDAPFAHLEIGRLEELRLRALEDRLETDLTLERHAEIVIELEKLAAEHPFRERLWGQLMVALYRCDRQAEALRVYQELRRHLGDELGIEPSTHLQQLEERILLQDAELQLPPAAPAAGMLRGYELRERLGEGAFGVVWRAGQPSVGRDVAIKAIRPEYSNRSDFVLGFEAEAQLIAALAHPHIVPIYDFWRDPNGAYLVMRLMESGSLDSVETSKWPTPQILRVVEQVGSGLAYAHQRGLVHGDLHPGNVLLDEEDNAYLADFGLAAEPAGAISTPPAGYASPEQLSGDVPGPRSDVYGLGRLVFRMLTGDDPREGLLPSVRTRRPDLATPVDDMLRRSMAADPAVRPRDAGEFLEDLRVALGTAPAGAPEPRNPYKGLRPFEEADARDFFGRDALIEELASVLSNHRLAGVVGPSGCGKSSLVRAGLIPALRSGGLPGSDGWLYTDLYPGEDPFARLADALLRLAVAEPPGLLDRLRDPETIAATVGEMMPPDAELVVVIDQFEELFSLCPEEGDRRRFMDCVAALAGGPESRVRIVVTVRADFYGLPLQYRPFGDALRSAAVGVTPPGPEDLAHAITGPARGVGMEVERELIADLVDDVTAAPGGLPLMQYALTRLFDETDGTTLTAETYRRTGGVLGVLESRPEQLFEALPEPTRPAARQLLLRLVSVDDAGEPRRRRVSLPELQQLGVPHQQVATVLDEFTAARLLTLDRDPVSRTPTVEIAHDALLDHWGRIRGWIEGRREELVLYRRLRAAHADWEASGRDPEYLLQGGRLRQFETWAEQTDLVRTEAETDFVDRSRAQEEEAAASRRRRRGLVTTTLVIIALVAVAFGALAFVQRNRANDQQETAEQQALVAEQQAAVALEEGQRAESERRIADTERARAEEQEQIARARGLAAASAAQLDTDPELSVLLAIEAVEAARPHGEVLREAEEALHAAVNANRLVTTAPVAMWARSLAYSADGERFYVGGGNGTGQIIGFPGGAVEAELPYGRTSVLALGGGDDQWLIVADYDGLITVRDADTLEELFVLEHGQGFMGWITDLEVSADGTVLASVNPYDETLIVWDLDQTVSIATFDLGCNPSCSRGVALSPDGSMVTSGKTIWDVATQTQIVSVPLAGQVSGVEFLDNARMIVTDGFVVRIVDVDSGEIVETLYGHNADVLALDVSPDGGLVASGGRDGLVNVWELSDTGPRSPLTLGGHQGSVWEVRFATDGRHLTSLGGRQEMPEIVVTWPQDWEARIWDVTVSGSREWMTSITNGGVASFAPDGLTVISGNEQSGATIRNVADASPVLAIPGPDDSSRTTVVAFSPDGSQVATGGTIPVVDEEDVAAGWLNVHDADTGALIRNVVPPTPGLVPNAISFSPEGDRLALAAQGLARVWDAETWETMFTPSDLTETDHFTAVGFSPDGVLLATQYIPPDDAEWPDGVRVWDITTQEVVSRLDHLPRIDRGSVQFSPDGRIMLVAGQARPELAEPFTGRVLARLEASPAYAARAAFSPDGMRIATGEADGTIRIWDAAIAEEQLILKGHTADVMSVAFHPAGDQLVSVGLDGTMRVWALDLDDLLGMARDRVTRDLTGAECRAYLGEGCAPAAAPERLLPAT
ncbi:MAG: protein kinase, partial [Acidimicrobiia bacterium]|nr:protein kinase [Acidimicrobiia bacterium]